MCFAFKENVVFVKKLRGGCFCRFPFIRLSFCGFRFFYCARCFYSIKLIDKPPEVGGLLCLYEDVLGAYFWVYSPTCLTPQAVIHAQAVTCKYGS